MTETGGTAPRAGFTRLLTAVVLAGVASGLVVAVAGKPPLATGFAPPGDLRLALQLLGAAWWLAMARLVVVVIDLVLGRLFFGGDRPRARKLVADLVAVLVYFAAVWAIVAVVFEEAVTGLIATSGVVAVVLGLALQNTLADLFSGVALNLERPFRAGDWVTVGDVIGVVMETNWRATHIRTRTRDLVVIPNSAMARAQMVNHYRPTRTHAFRIDLYVDDRAPPDRVIDLLRTASLETEGVVTDPAPIVLIESMRDGLTQIALFPFIADYATMPLIRTAVWVRCWQHLNWAGIPVGLSRRDVRLTAPPPLDEPEAERRLARLLGTIGTFAVLSEDERARLAGGLRRLALAAGETLIRAGEEGQSMYVVAEGALTVRAADGTAVAARLGPGQPVGEMSLLTGAARRNTVVAERPAVVYEITRECLAPVLADRPAVLAELDQLVARRLAAPAAPAGGGGVPPRSVSDWFARVLKLS